MCNRAKYALGALLAASLFGSCLAGVKYDGPRPCGEGGDVRYYEYICDGWRSDNCDDCWSPRPEAWDMGVDTTFGWYPIWCYDKRDSVMAMFVDTLYTALYRIDLGIDTLWLDREEFDRLLRTVRVNRIGCRTNQDDAIKRIMKYQLRQGYIDSLVIDEITPADIEYAPPRYFPHLPLPFDTTALEKEE